MSTGTMEMTFYASGVDTLLRLLVMPFFVVAAWASYKGGNVVLMAVFLIAIVAYIYAVVQQTLRPLFIFREERLLVRDSFGAHQDIRLDEITGIDESPWMGIEVSVNLKPRRLFVDRLSKEEGKRFLEVLRERTGIQASVSFNRTV